MRFYPSSLHLFAWNADNKGDLRMNSEIQPFITLHFPSSFLPFLAHFQLELTGCRFMRNALKVKIKDI